MIHALPSEHTGRCPRLEVDLIGEDASASRLSKMAIPCPDVLHFAVGLAYPGVRDGHGHDHGHDHC